ncbi:uncharacterized protein LOC128244918 [Mya arenaria]|uniref:uncharacterized protein LOC128244918 n=1 Tax=Mya arenaria TaxID=6604 RepID=UPI0022E62B83|nr:uncharacterized protein LOC128244918 [Mya arenaria]
MAMMGRTSVGLRATGTTCRVPNHPKAKLMYYLNCMCTVLKMEDEDADISRLRRYNNYASLSSADTDLLVLICLALKPDVLLNKCIFQSDAMCKDSGNEFYDLEAVRDSLLVAGSVIVGGRTKRVSKIMTFKMSWLNDNWVNPMKALIQEQENKRVASAARRRREESSGCAIM